MTPFRPCRLSPSSVPNVINEEVGLALNRAKPIHVVLHLLVSVALLVMASVVVAQSNRTSAPRRAPTAAAPKVSGNANPASATSKSANPASGTLAAGASGTLRQAVRTAPHTPIGLIKKLPRSITRRKLNAAQTRMARTFRAKGSTRVAGDTGVPRQTILLTQQNPSANFSFTPAASYNRHPFWSGDESYIYFESDRISQTNSASNSTTPGQSGTFNIYKTVGDGSTIAQVTTGTDQKIDPSVSTQSNRLAYVGGGQITNPSQPQSPSLTTGFNLFVLDLNGGTPLQLTNVNSKFSFADVRHPSFAPGGADIVFAGKLTGDTVYHIFTVNVAQGTIVQYTSGVANDYSPAWSPATPNGSTVIAYTSNAASLAQSQAPVASTSTHANDEVFVFQPITVRPSPRAITNFSVSGSRATNRNPAWSTTRIDTRTYGVPVGVDSNGTPTGQGRILLAFASSRADTDSTNPGVPNAVSGNGSTDIYFMDAPIGTDVRDNSVTTVTKPEVPFDANGNYTGAHKVNTSNPELAIDAEDKPGLTDFDPNHSSTEDYPTWPQFINSYRIAFQSDRGTFVNLWASSILDLDAPTLLKYDEGTNEIVRVEAANAPGVTLQNRYVDPGTAVRFKVRAVDYQSGIKYVYLQIKCPDSAPQSSDGVEHKIFYGNNAGAGANLNGVGPIGLLQGALYVIDPPYEYDYQAIKASDTGSGAKFRPAGGKNAPKFLPTVTTWPGFNLYQPTVDDVIAFSGGQHPPDDSTIPPSTNFFPDGENGYWLQLVDDGTNTGTYTGTWQTPVGFASDMVIDVILYDNAVYPFDTTGGTTSNWKIYDNIWGFTTKRFTSQGQVLYVDDYDSGQKFLNASFGTANLATSPVNAAGLAFEGTPTESWMTEFDPGLIPTLALQGIITYPIINFLQPLGANSYADALTGTGTNGGPITGQYDIWRIQCRGPIPNDVLNIYGTSTITQPPDQLGGQTQSRTVTVADKCIIWHAPYTGDLFVGPGTLLDLDTQTRLTAFVNNGGRLFVNGQEIGFGLSLGQTNTPGSTLNDFLNNTLRAYYLADQAFTSFPSDKINGPTEAKVGGLHPIAYETWYDQFHGYPSAAGPEPPLSKPPIFVGYSTIPYDHSYECPNTGAEGGNGGIMGFPNLVTFHPPTDPPLPTTILNPPVTGKMYPGVYGIEGYYNPQGNNPAIMWWKNVTTQGKVVFSPIGWETIFPDFYQAGTTVVMKNRRAELMHNVLDLLRTGRIVGTIRSKNSSGSVTAPIPNAFVRVQRADPVSGVATTYGTAKTQADGTYVIAGLDPSGVYTIDAAKTGFITQHGTGAYFHGGYQSQSDFYLIQAQPGQIGGTITTQGNNLPVSGAIVTATDTTDPTATFVSLPSAADGSYVISNLPASSYTLKITNLATIGYSSSIPASLGPVAITAGQSLTGQNFKVTQPPGTVTGTVVVADASGNPTTTPIPGATVTATLQVTGSTPQTTTTSANGTYTLSLSPGIYLVQASAAGYVTSGTLSVTVATNNTVASINFALKPIPPGSISGLVTTSPPLSAPVSGATVTVVDGTGATLTATSTAVKTTTLANGTTYKYNYVVANVAAGTATSPASVQATATKPGYTPKPNPNTQTVSVTSAIETQNVNFVLDPLFTFSPGLTLVSSPYVFTGTSITDLFSIPSSDINNTFGFVAWNANTQQYIYYPNSPADSFHLGVGYFLQETNSLVTLALTSPNGTQAPKDATGNYLPFNIPLAQGWNLIGDPYVNSVDLAKLQIKESNGTLVDVPTAQTETNPAIGSALFTYQNGSYQVIYTLDPFRGDWLYAYRPCTLVVSAGAQQTRGAALDPIASLTGDGWHIKLTATASDTAASNAYLGVSKRATDGFDRFKLLAPPAATQQSVQIAFPHKDWGTKSANYMMDIRSATANTWDFTLTSNVPNTPVVLSWPGITTMSRRQDLQLLDLDTNQAISLRNRSSIAIPVNGNTLTKHYRLTVTNANPNQDLQLTNLTVLQNGGNRSTGAPVGINYNLSADATVQISILQNGRHIRTVATGSTRAAGNNQATWDLKTDQGASIPAGVYTVEVKAVHPVTGRTVRQTSPVLVTR